jgi:phage terminase large subunit-like protein
MRSYPQRAEDYADDVLSGKIPAGDLIGFACERFKRDLKRKDIVLTEKATAWCAFQELMPHVKGKWAGKHELLTLSPWQIFATVNLYGFYYIDSGRRRFREAFILVPRKNGKTFYVSTLALGHLCIDKEPGAEIYCGASTEKQAYEVFSPARRICQKFPSLVSRFGLEINKKVINRHSDGSKFEPVIGDPGDGSSPSCAISDEYHEHKTTDQADTFVTGMGARENPMMIYISTAGADIGGPCYAKQLDCIDIVKNTVEDDRTFVLIYGLDDADEWDTVEAQIKANPNYGVSVDAEFLKAQLATARRSAVAQSAYRTKHLNQWLGAKTAWMNMLAYQACRKKALSIKDYAGEQCIVAADLASTDDIACLAVLFPYADRPAVFVKHYLPEEVVLSGGNTRYKAWHSDGWITATPGVRIDFDYIEEDLKELATTCDVVSVPYDKFQATQFATRMDAEGLPMVQFGATVQNFSEPMKELEKAIAQKRLDFEMDPVLMWMFGNVVAKIDAKDNIFPRKERSENKIDGVVALIMAYGVYVQMQPKTIPSMMVL